MIRFATISLFCLVVFECLSGSVLFRPPAFTRDLSTRQEDPVSDDDTLRVLGYNIHMWQIGVDELATLIREADADIVGLNEAWDESRNDEIARKLEYNIIYGGQNQPENGEPEAHTINGFYMPQVLLTKHRIIESRIFSTVEEKEHDRFDPDVPIYRGGTMALLETDQGNRVVVFVLHLHPWGSGDNEKMTAMRLAEMNGILDKLNPYQDLPVLLIGDFNTRSHLDDRTGWKVSRRLEEKGFHDLYRTVNPSHETAPGHTCGASRIDYIFYNRHVLPVECKVVSEGVFDSRGYEQSDHLAVFGVVKIGNQACVTHQLPRGRNSR